MARQRFPARPCPVCGSGHSQLLYHQSFDRLASACLLDGYDVVICDDCGAGFADDIPPQAAFDDYYRDLSKYEDAAIGGSQPPPPVDQRFRDTAALIAKFITARDARILEIGCASGGLLKALQDLGYSRLTGSDPSPGCVRAVREFYGIDGIVCSLFAIPDPAEPYDFLILTGVMEHLRDLDLTVAQFRKLLRKGGRVYLEVPDGSRYDASLDAPFQEFSVEHINFFSKTSLTNLMQARGFSTFDAGRMVRPLHEVTCPCTYGVFENLSAPPNTERGTERDTETEPGLRAYVEGCLKEDTRIRAAIESSLHAGERMIVWGVGTHTLRLLATGGMDPAHISLFVDSNPKYQQQQLRGVPIVSPAQLKSADEPILISSRSSQREIQHQIQKAMGLKNPLILLYGRDQGGNRVEPE